MTLTSPFGAFATDQGQGWGEERPIQDGQPVLSGVVAGATG